MKASAKTPTLCTLLITFFPLASLAQKNSGQAVRETASVTVVEVPVNVIGKDGRPVSNLTAADFELYDEGKLQAITGFDRVDLGRPVPGDVFEMPASARRLWLLVFNARAWTLHVASADLRPRLAAQRGIFDAVRSSLTRCRISGAKDAR